MCARMQMVVWVAEGDNYKQVSQCTMYKDVAVLLLTCCVVSPLVNISMETVAVQGNPLTLDCQVIGQPTPTVTWFQGSTQITADSRRSIDGSGRLVFTSVLSTDAGTYRCQASNERGSASADTVMRVLGRPSS